MSEALSTRRFDVRQEPRFDQARPAAGDPLAELARLVGQDDPFRSMFRADAPPTAQESDARHGHPAYEDEHDGTQRQEAAMPDPAMFGHDDHRRYDENHDGHAPYQAHDDYAEFDGHAPVGHDDHGHAAVTYAGGEAYEPDGGIDRHDPHASMAADVWAQDGDDHAGSAPFEPEAGDDAGGRSRTPRRPLVVLAAVLLLTTGGLAATYFARTGTGAVAGREAPTILAASGPNKVKLADPSATGPEDADAALLNKNGAAPTGTAKVVSSQEEPTDLAQLPKSTARSDGGSETASPFPQPKKVKTFVVRPDGSFVGGPPASAPVAPPTTRTADANPFPVGLVPSDPAPTTTPVVPRAGTPKTAARPPTTPKVTADTTISDLAELPAGTAAGKARQPASPGVHATPKAKPVELAEADAGAAPTSTGNFGLQLAAAPSEQDARDAFSKLQKKFSGQLGSFKPTIRKADAGDKTVYRVRVGNLAQDEAKTLCSQLQASGGSCYVVHN